MTEEQKEYYEYMLHQSRIRMVILYILPDICEALMLDIDEYRKKAGVQPLKFRDKYVWKGFLKDARELNKVLHTTDFDTQYKFSDVCEYIQNLIMYAIDRCGNDDGPLMEHFIEYIKSFPSKRQIEFKY